LKKNTTRQGKWGPHRNRARARTDLEGRGHKERTQEGDRVFSLQVREETEVRRGNQLVWRGRDKDGTEKSSHSQRFGRKNETTFRCPEVKNETAISQQAEGEKSKKGEKPLVLGEKELLH